MARRSGAVHVVTTRREYKGKTYHSHLLRRSYREDGKVKNETVANLSHLPEHIVEIVRRSLRGERFVEVNELFDVEASPQHGNVEAVAKAMRALGLPKVIAGKRCRERDLVLAMIAARIISPQSKLATSRWWHQTTIPETFGVEDANEDDLYGAMDWLLNRQDTIERKLAARHLVEDGLVLYDISSSYFEGTKCPLACRGHSRDRKRDTVQVNYGLVTDALGCPVSVSVFPGNTNDCTTLLGEIDGVRSRFGIESLVAVGDRGMILQKQIDGLAERGADWITALRSVSIRRLVDQGALQLGLFDQRNLFEFRHPDYPDERFVACRNPDLAEHRRHKRVALLEATTAKLAKIRERVDAGRLQGKAEIGVRVGKVLNAYKVGKHFDLEIEDKLFQFEVNEQRVAAEAALDGIYVIRTSLPKKRLEAPAVVEAYKRLCHVERAFRSFKTVDLHVRPIRHWTENRVRAHIFLCMLAYYVQYHMQEAWRPLLFFDEEAWTKTRENPVAAAKRSRSALRKAATKTTAGGERVHSFRTLLAELGGIVCNVCRRKGAGPDEPPVKIATKPSPGQSQALDLLDSVQM